MALPVWIAASSGGIGYKIIQAMTDEVWPGTEFPEDFRQKLIDSHIFWWGTYCKECWRKVARADLTVDHVVPIRKGGFNSRHNAQVMCRECNSRKGDRVSILDRFLGRGGAKPRIRA